jgi:beta-glucosidase
VARVDEAVRRILTVKVRMGLFENPFADRSLLPAVGCEEHREAAREAVRRSLVLLKNSRRTLPIGPAVKRILVTGARADDLGSQCGGWTITWQGATGGITEGTTILDAIEETGGERIAIVASKNGKLPEGEPPVDLVILVIGETPYTENRGDRQDLSLSIQDKAALDAACGVGAPVAVVLISGRPLIVTEEIERADAFVAAWLPGTEGAGVADVLFGRAPFRGKLPMPWPRDSAHLGSAGNGNPLFPYGWGLED